MDIAWRVCVESLLSNCGQQAVAHVDALQGIVIIHDPDQLLTKKRLRMMNRIADASSTAPDRRGVVERAIEARDVVPMKQCARTLVHYVFMQLKFVSQEAHASRSIHYAFRSRVYHTGSPPTYTHGPPIPHASGLSIQCTVHPTVLPWITHLYLYIPQLIRDETIAEALADAAAGGVPCTPRRLDDTASIAATDATPTMSVKDDLLKCEVCLRTVPFTTCVFLESCPHYFCLTCITACAQKHCSAVDATPTTMPCPSLGCNSKLLSSELRMLIASDSFSELEAVEVRLALQTDAVVCPHCSFTFESFLQPGIREDDPLRLKIHCGSCGADFCRRCFTAPFHAGKPCVEGGVGHLVPKCRYCGNSAVSTDPLVCDSLECQAKGQSSCTVTKSCGHPCMGTIGEAPHCVPCLEEGCVNRHGVHTADDFCNICYTDSLRDAPCLQLRCGHVFHASCLELKLEKRWPTARISFAFATCPLCAEDIYHPLLQRWLEPLAVLQEQLTKRYMERLKIEAMLDVPALTDPSSEYFEQPLAYARQTLNYYLCSKCSKPYFGGLRACQNVEREEPDRADLVCGGCSAGSAQCVRHGNQYMEWKCKYCCNTAVWYCWGTTHFCELCHSPPRKSVREECPGEELCPLKGRHLPNGTEFAIGCAMCRADQVVNLKK